MKTKYMRLKHVTAQKKTTKRREIAKSSTRKILFRPGQFVALQHRLPVLQPNSNNQITFFKSLITSK